LFVYLLVCVPRYSVSYMSITSRGDKRTDGQSDFIRNFARVGRHLNSGRYWTKKKWVKIENRVETIGVTRQVERKYFTLYGFQLPFCPTPSFFNDERHPACQKFSDTSSLCISRKQIVRGKQSEVLLCVLDYVITEVSKQYILFETSGIAHPTMLNNTPESSTSGSTHSTERNVLLLFSYILGRERFLCQADNFTFQQLSLRK
jgi:hypothetical protein